jgi:hypothetical protein
MGKDRRPRCPSAFWCDVEPLLALADEELVPQSRHRPDFDESVAR